MVLVHIPALIAKALIPSLYPLRLALFDPLTQVGCLTGTQLCSDAVLQLCCSMLCMLTGTQPVHADGHTALRRCSHTVLQFGVCCSRPDGSQKHLVNSCQSCA